MDAQKDIILPNAFGYFATIGNRPPHIYSLCAFTTVHDEWGKKQGRPGLIHHVSGHEVDGRREESVLKYSCTKLQVALFASHPR